MNHIYRSIWSEVLNTWIAVPENTASKGKRSSMRKNLLSIGLILYSSGSWALPTGEQVVAGQVNVATPNAGQMQINQSSQQAIINWQGFSIAPSESVNILQPNPSAALLNRVVGMDASVIQGQLHANGLVYLINPNGVLFSNTAQVDVGGLIASTHSLNNADFLNGHFHFTQDYSHGTVDNQGYIRSADGGVVALIGTQVSNNGTIETPQGTTILAAGKTVDLDFKGNGLVEVKVPEAALNAQVENKGVIFADGGRVVLTAKAAGDLVGTVLNSAGVIRAQSLVSRNGEIILDGGDNGLTQVSGTLNTNGQQAGGTISVTGKNVNINNTANLTAQALQSGIAGTIKILGDMHNGTLRVAGNLNASAPVAGNGGFIETSAAHVKIADSATVSTLARNGSSGTWLIDPADFTIAASGGDMTGAVVSSALAGGNFTIQSTSGSTAANGDVNLNDVVNWSVHKLTLNAQRNININANLNGSGSAQLALQYGQASLNGGTNDNYFINNGAKINLPAGLNFSTKKGNDTELGPINYTVITSLGTARDATTAPSIMTLQGLAAISSLTGNYALGGDINASATSGWNSNAGFVPIGTYDVNRFIGQFHGLGHSISSLNINSASNYDDVGLFGDIGSGGLIRDIGLSNAHIAAPATGFQWTGALAGYLASGAAIYNSYASGGNVRGSANDVGGLVGDNDGNISNSYATNSVSGAFYVGGLIGYNSGSISNSFATGNITGTDFIAGLVGNNDASISNSYATGNVSGTHFIGGLVGDNAATGNTSNSYATGNVNGSNSVGGLAGENYGSINNSYATGQVIGTSNVGGLIGFNSGGTVTNSFWNKVSSGQTTSAGSLATFGKTTAEMMQASTFTGWDISNTGSSSAIWRIYQGNTTPLLRSFLVPLTITTSGTNISYSIANANSSGHLFSSDAGFYSDQQGFDITNKDIPPSNHNVIEQSVSDIINSNVTRLVTTVTNEIPKSSLPVDTSAEEAQVFTSNSTLTQSTIHDTTEDFTGAPRQQLAMNSAIDNDLVNLGLGIEDDKKLIRPILKVKNKAGRVKDLHLSANKQFLSLLLEDGSVRIWDFQRGVQRLINPQNTKQLSTDIGSVNDNGDFLSIASKASIGAYDVLSSSSNTKLNESGISHFTTSNDGSLLLVNIGSNELSLWNNQQNQKNWQLLYPRGEIKSLTIADNKQYAAVLSHQQGSYLLPASLRLKNLTDAVNIIELKSGKIIKSLPNLGEQIVSMQFKDNHTLQLGLNNGAVIDWSMTTNSGETVADFAEPVIAVDRIEETYAYVVKDGAVRVSNGQGNIQLSIENKEDPFKQALLLDKGKKLLTVLSSGDLALWDVASGQKMLRLFSTLQGWTVMDAFGRFDGSEEAMENFIWLAKEENIPLDSFSENYYEPGLLASVLQNRDYLNSHPNIVREGINLPPKIELQLAEQQSKGDSVALQVDAYDRGGGINNIKIYLNGKLLNNENIIEEQKTQRENEADHQVLRLNIAASNGKNTLKVIASNTMGIENSSSELSFDGKTKAYSSSLKLLTIGIDQYSDAKLNLDYSVADANSIKQAIKNNSKLATNTSLYNQNATKAKILAELKELSQGSQQDVLVVYLAGHGIALGKEWYFLPYETRLQPSLEKIAATGITATELSDIFKNSKIQHILLVVDSCYSGASMDAFSKLENGQHYFTRQLSRSLGITVVTATTKNQQAAELKSLGHGLFTYLMTQELQNKNGTTSMTAHKIAENIVKSLPIFSKKILGSIQEPVSYTHGNDFVLIDALKQPNKTGSTQQ